MGSTISVKIVVRMAQPSEINTWFYDVYIILITSNVISVSDSSQRDKGKIYALVERPLFKVGYDTGRNEYEHDYTRYEVCDNVQDEAQLRSHHSLRFVAVMSSENLRIS